MALAAHEPQVSWFGTTTAHPFCNNDGARGWFIFVTLITWLTTLVLSICYFLNINNAKKQINWQVVELVHSAVAGALCLIAAITQAAVFPDCAQYASAATIAFFLVAAFVASTWSAYNVWRS